MSEPRDRTFLVTAAALLVSLLPGCATPPELPDAPPLTHLEYLVLNGRPDYSNRYASTVQVIANNASCSGVLIHSRLVLTAAHCFCLPAQPMPERAYRYTPRNSPLGNELKLNCLETTEVTAVRYALDEGSQEDSSEAPGNKSSSKVKESGMPQLKGRQGSVHIHEGYEFFTDGAGDVVASKVDLAVVELTKPFEGIAPDSKLAIREVQPEESLTVVGYGLASNDRWGIRHFGRNNVMDIHISVGEDGLFAFRSKDGIDRAAHAWRGDSGGPCFREDDKGNRWLACIVSTGQLTRTGMVTTFTSVFHHREWIKRQLDLLNATAPSR